MESNWKVGIYSLKNDEPRVMTKKPTKRLSVPFSRRFSQVLAN